MCLYSVRKGQSFFIPILAINRSEELWGADAREFKYVYDLMCTSSLMTD